MNIAAKHVIQCRVTKTVNFDQILKSQVYDLSYNFGLWTVNTKSEKCVTLHSDFLEMSYESHIKMKFLAPLPSYYYPCSNTDAYSSRF